MSKMSDLDIDRQNAEADPFSDEALGQRTPEAIAQDDRQAADSFSDARYYDALVVICEEQGAGRWARAIDLVSKIWGKTTHEVMSDAVSL
jgi:hypothetical protein